MVSQAAMDALGYTGGAVLALCIWPQVHRMVTTRSARDISLTWTLLYTLGLTLTFVYLYLEGAVAAWIPMLLELLGVLVIMVLKLIYDHTRFGAHYDKPETAADADISLHGSLAPSLGRCPSVARSHRSFMSDVAAAVAHDVLNHGGRFPISDHSNHGDRSRHGDRSNHGNRSWRGHLSPQSSLDHSNHRHGRTSPPGSLDGSKHGHDRSRHSAMPHQQPEVLGHGDVRAGLAMIGSETSLAGDGAHVRLQQGRSLYDVPVWPLSPQPLRTAGPQLDV